MPLNHNEITLRQQQNSCRREKKIRLDGKKTKKKYVKVIGIKSNRNDFLLRFFDDAMCKHKQFRCL